MSVNELPPSAPEYSQTENLYPLLPTSPDAFRLRLHRTDESARLAISAKWQKNIKKNVTITRPSAIGLGAVTAALSSAGIATAVTGIGAFASVPIGGVAAITGISSSLLTGLRKKNKNTTQADQT